MRVLACLLERLRLADGPHGCAGRLEVWHSGRWGTVCDDGWDLRDAAVACRELGCGAALAAPGGAFFGEGAGPVWLSELACRGGEGQLGLCPHRGWKAHVCSHEEDAGVVCAGKDPKSSGLSGELSPSSEEPPVTHTPRPAGTPQSSSRKKSPRPPKQAKSTRAPALMAGAPHHERLRLASGPHGCAGRLEVWHGGRWGTVCDDGWDLRDAAVACRELGCGGALAAPGGARFGPGSGPVWMDDVGCGGGEQALRDCPRSPWGRSNCDHSEDAGLVCTGPAPRLRLADGPHGCAGRLEVWHGGRWGSVCDDSWDLRDAAVACGELGCGAALAAPGGAFFGEGAGPILLDDLRCRGNETALRFCPSRPWGQHDCHHREDAGAVCDGGAQGKAGDSMPREGASRPPPPTAGQAHQTASKLPLPASPAAPWEPGPEAGSPQLRLVAGPSRCSGRLEVWHAGLWGTVCDDSWDLRDSAVVCRELGCGGARQPDPSVDRFGWGAGPIWLDDVGCVGTEASLSDCPAAPWGKHNCAHNEDVGVTCTGTPGLDSISDPFSWSWIPGLGRDPDVWLPRELATKPSARLTSSVPEKTTKAPGKMPKSTKKWVTKHAKRPTTQPPVMPTAKRSRVPGTQGPPELTLQTTTALNTEVPYRLSSHTTAVLIPRGPRVWTSKTLAMPTTQSPQQMTSEDTVKRIPLASVELSAEIPAEGSPESSKDPLPSPTGGTSGGSSGRWTQPVCWPVGGVACWTLGDSVLLGAGLWTGRCGIDLHWYRGRWGWGWSGAGVGSMGAQLSPTFSQGHADEEDYPSWTWDPTSGEDLAQGTTGAPTADILGPSLTTGTTRSVGHPSPAPRVRTGRKPGHDRRLLRPTAARTVPPSSSPGPPLTSDSAPLLIPDTPSTQVTSHPPDTLPSSSNPASWKNSDLTLTTPGLTSSTSDATVVPALTPELSPTPPPTLPKELTSDPSSPAVVTRLSPTSELTPDSDTTPGWDTTPYSIIVSGPSRSPDLSTSPHPTTTLPSTMTSHPTTTPRSITTPHPTRTPHSITTPHPTRTLQPPTTTHPTMTPDSTSTPMITTKSLLISLETELPFPTSAPTVKPSLPSRFTFREAPHPFTSKMSSPDLSPASESSPSRPSPTPNMDTSSTEDFKPPRNQSPKVTPLPIETPHSASDPILTPDLHLSPMARSLGPCVASMPPVKVMACEPPALVELVAAVRDMGSQLQRLTQALERDQQERQAVELRLTQLVEAARGLGQLSEVMKRLAEVAWHPSTPAPTTTTREEEERPLRGDV
uniref:Soluble scavenger receptor cysteine-rich domain-containing protein SSC5D n=1 Tax=Rhinolophus ferrumequinum TaxID=59479 RepID=A0A671FSS4_RHIFE